MSIIYRICFEIHLSGLRGLSDAKNAVGGSKNIPLTAEGIIRHM
jgi:hypothetical protein